MAAGAGGGKHTMDTYNALTDEEKNALFAGYDHHEYPANTLRMLIVGDPSKGFRPGWTKAKLQDFCREQNLASVRAPTLPSRARFVGF